MYQDIYDCKIFRINSLPEKLLKASDLTGEIQGVSFIVLPKIQVDLWEIFIGPVNISLA